MFRLKFFVFFIFFAVFCMNVDALTIAIDPGHGGKNLGARSKRHSFQEKQYTLSTAKKLKRYLQKKGYRVVLTRKRDVYLPLKKRAEIANRHKADLFVSIHFNSAPGLYKVHGVEVYYYAHRLKRNVVGRSFAQEVLDQIIKRTKAHSRGVKPARFVVLGETKMPAILVEGGFLTNRYERKKIKDPKYLDQLAQGIAEGVHQFLEMKKKGR